MLFHLSVHGGDSDSIFQMKWRLRESATNPSSDSQQAARAQTHTLFRPLSCAHLTASAGARENWWLERSVILAQPSCPLRLLARRIERKE